MTTLARASSAAFWVSGALLVLQVSFTRLLAFKLFYHYVFLAVALALLGLSAAGTTVAVRKRPAKTERRVAFWLSTLIASVPLVFLLLELPFLLSDSPKPQTLRGAEAAGYLLWSAPLVLWLFFCGGMVLSCLFSELSAHMPRLYARDLLGAGAGCLICLWLMDFGSPPIAFVTASFLTLPAWLRYRRAFADDARLALRDKTRVYVGIGFGLLICFGPASLRSFSSLEPLKNGWIIKSEWNHLLRTDHVVGRQQGFLGYYVLDNDACTDVVIWNERQRRLPVTEPAYILGAPKPSVAVIGFGGGRQIAEARRAGARSILGVDINPAIARWVQNEDRPYNGGLFDDPSCELRVGEGRHELRSAGEQFDVIVMHAIDTYTATAAGSYALSENFLYTSEAIQDFLGVLSPNGILTISRWLFNPPRENLRLFSTALHALEEMGAENPTAHVVMIAPVKDYNALAGKRVWGYLLIAREPFTANQIKRLQAHVAAQEWQLLYAYGVDTASPFSGLAQSTDRRAFARDYPYKIDPVTDASPYLFQFQDPFNPNSYSSRSGKALDIHQASAIVLLVSPLVAFLLSGLVVIFPLWWVGGRAGQSSRLGWRQVVFFSGLGVGFMGLEIPLVQALSLYLGHPTYGFSVVLVSLLVFAGAGSLVAARVNVERKGIVCLALSVALALTSLVLLPLIHVSIALPTAARFALAVLTVGALAFPLGFPLALGVKQVGGRFGPQGVAWAWGVNGASSVVGSCVVMPIMVFFGTGAALVLAACCYVASALAARGWGATQANDEGGAEELPAG